MNDSGGNGHERGFYVLVMMVPRVHYGLGMHCSDAVFTSGLA